MPFDAIDEEAKAGKLAKPSARLLTKEQKAQCIEDIEQYGGRTNSNFAAICDRKLDFYGHKGTFRRRCYQRFYDNARRRQIRGYTTGYLETYKSKSPALSVP